MFHKKTINSQLQNGRAKFDLINRALIYLLFVLFIVLGLRYQFMLLNYKEWGDESETIVAAKMLSAGMKLYSEVFNHHGPLTFLPGVITESIGNFGVQGHRIPIAILQILSVISIYKYPGFGNELQRILALISSATVILLLMPNIFGQMYKYQTISGLFIVVIMSQYTIPAICCPDMVRKVQIIVCNFLIASLPFLAITYLPISVLLLIASFRSSYLKCVFIGCTSGLFLNLVFLGAYGSFTGYLAFHVYLNSQILPIYTNMPVGSGLIFNIFRVLSGDYKSIILGVVVLICAVSLARTENKIPWRTFFLVLGILSLLMRGGGFHGMPFYYSVIALITITVIGYFKNGIAYEYITTLIIAFCVVKVSLIIPRDLHKIVSDQPPRETEFSKLVTELTEPEDKIIVYTFQNYQYLVSDRLPASGHFFYLPWQEKYNEAPRFGIMIDACQQIKDAKPKIMYVDKWKVWDKFPWDSYAGCIQDFIDLNYSQIPGKPYFIRNDLSGRLSHHLLN